MNVDNKNKIKIAVVGDSHTALITSKLIQITNYEITNIENNLC